VTAIACPFRESPAPKFKADYHAELTPDFISPANADHNYAVTLIRAAMERRPLPYF
jgi:hypothetical protein